MHDWRSNITKFRWFVRLWTYLAVESACIVRPSRVGGCRRPGGRCAAACTTHSRAVVQKTGHGLHAQALPGGQESVRARNIRSSLRSQNPGVPIMPDFTSAFAPRQAGCLSEVQSRFQGTHYATPPGLAYPHGLRKPSHRASTNTSQHPLIHLPNQTSVATIPRTRQVQSMDGGGSSVTLRWLVSRHNSYILLACSLLRGQYDKASFSSLKGYFFVCSEK